MHHIMYVIWKRNSVNTQLMMSLQSVFATINMIPDIDVTVDGVIKIIFEKQIPDYKSKYKPKLYESASVSTLFRRRRSNTICE